MVNKGKFKKKILAVHDTKQYVSILIPSVK